VVGPTSIIPGLLQAWGCEKMPNGLGPATFIQVIATFIHVTATFILVIAGGSWIKADTHLVCHSGFTTDFELVRQGSTLLGRNSKSALLIRQ